MSEIELSKIDLKSLAIVVCDTLSKSGIDAVLVGGACVSIYSENRYQSYDLDFVTYEELKKVVSILKEIGFVQKGRYFIHKDCPFFIDFVNPPIAVGNQFVKNFNQLRTDLGTLKLLTPTDCVKDRLSAYYHWDDVQSLEQAVLVAVSNEVDIEDIQKWSVLEGHSQKYEKFHRLMRKKR